MTRFTFCVTALPCKILIAIVVMFFIAKKSAFSFGNIFVKFYSNFTISEGVIPDNHYLQVLFLLMSGTSLKLGLTLWNQMTHRCNHVQWLTMHASW